MNKYELNKDFILQLDKQNVTIFNPESSQFYTFNKTASFILISLTNGMSVQQIVNKFCEEYSIELLDAKKEVLDTVNYLIKEEILQ